jgi:subtilisin family serine protease
MHKSWRFIPGFGALAVTIGAIAALGIGSAAAAQGKAIDATGQVKQYVLMVDGTWGAAQDAAVSSVAGTVDFSHGGSGIGVISSANPNFLKAALRSGAFARGAEDMMVHWQDPNLRVADETIEADAVTPGDETFINAQWNYLAVDAPGAWAAGYTGVGARVAILDGGIHSTHVDLDGNLDVARSTSFVPGFNFNQDTGTFWHGTHVAGIVAAEDNAIGTVGIAPGATIIGVKVLHNGSGSFGQVISGILYAADPIAEGGAGAHIINMSLGATFARGGGNTGAGPLVAAMNQAVNYATGRGVLVVSSAGNNAIDMDHSGNLINIPAQSGSGIAISATGPLGYAVGWPAGNQDFRRFASYSNYGHQLVWVAAPGGDFALPGTALCSIPRCCGGPNVVTNCWVFDMVMSTVRGASNATYGWSAGTSMAAPAASAVAALIVQKYPGIAVGELKTMLSRTADDEGPNGADPFYGHGFVNAYRAVTEPLALAPASTTEKLGTATAQGRVDLVIARNGSSMPEISFSLATAGPARVDLFDVSGRRVAVLYNGTASAGRTTLAWNGRDADGQSLRQGAYFARLTANDAQTSRQLVLLSE